MSKTSFTTEVINENKDYRKKTILKCPICGSSVYLDEIEMLAECNSCVWNEKVIREIEEKENENSN